MQKVLCVVICWQSTNSINSSSGLWICLLSTYCQRYCHNLGFPVSETREAISILTLTMLVWFNVKAAMVMK